MVKEQIQTLGDILSAYHDPQMINMLAKNPAVPVLGGEVHEAAVMMVNLRGFNQVCEQLPPEKVALMLNAYQGYIMEIIHRYGGVVDKMMGDRTLAYWVNTAEAPEDDKLMDRIRQAEFRAKAERTVRGALRAAHSIVRNRSELEEKLIACCGFTVQIDAGIHYGPVFVGNIGTQNLMDYTVVGNAVNVAAQLSDRAPQEEIYVSEAAVGLITGEFTFLTVLGDEGDWDTISTREGQMKVYSLCRKARELDAAQADLDKD